jgi:hypothetical protein
MITAVGSENAIRLFSTGSFCARVMDDTFRLRFTSLTLCLGTNIASKLFYIPHFVTRIMSVYFIDHVDVILAPLMMWGISADDIIALFVHPSHNDIAFGTSFARGLNDCGSSIKVYELLLKYYGKAASIMWRTGMTEAQVVQAQIDWSIVNPKK